jgi:hypothetical protein
VPERVAVPPTNTVVLGAVNVMVCDAGVEGVEGVDDEPPLPQAARMRVSKAAPVNCGKREGEFTVVPPGRWVPSTASKG